MTSYSWTTGTSGVWTTAANWTPATVPDDVTTPGTADVTIDAKAPIGGAYSVTLAAGTSETIDSLIINGVTNLAGSNSSPYNAAEIEIDGTLVYAPGSAGLLGGSLQTLMFMNGGTIVNAGTVDAFVQTQGDVLFTGTNGIYFTNFLQSVGGTVTIDTSSIAEMTGNTLFDGIYEEQGLGATVDFGGTLTGIVNITTIEGPPLNPGGWTEVLYNDPTGAIDEWNGTAYVPIATTLTEIDGAGTVDVLDGGDYTTTNTLTINAGVGTIAPGMLNLQAGTVTTGGLDINGGIVQGYATIAGDVVNDGTLIAVGGTLALTGSLSGSGTVEFDIDVKAGTVDLTGATLSVGSVSSGQTIVMDGSDTLQLNAPGSFAGTIEASVGDTIILTGVTATSASLNSGTLVVFDGTQTVGTFALAGTYTGEHVAVTGSDLTFATGASGPSITGTAAGQMVADTGTIAAFSGVVIADTNVGQFETVTVTLSAPANGTLINLGGGSYDATTGVYTDTGSAAAVTSALDGLVFVPTPQEVAPGQTVTTGFTISDVDTGLATATDSTTTVITTAGTVVPTIAGTVGGQVVLDTGTVAPFAGVTIGDVNLGQTETLTVALSVPANGTLTNLGGGSYDATTGVYTDIGSAVAVTAALDGLVFVPTAHEVPPGQTATTGFTVSDTDSAGATATDTTTSVIATATTELPTITGTVGGQTVADTGTIAPFSGVTISDVNAGQTETLTVTLSAAANGTLTNLGGGSYDATTGVYTDIGSAVAVTAALDGLVFVPTAGEAPTGQTVATGFTINDTDTAGASATDTTTSVIAAGSGSGSPSVPPNEVVLPGPSSQYVIADDLGSLYIQGPSGTQVLPGVNEMVFTDGTGVFDPTGSAEDIARLYQTVLDRAPDVGGLLNFTGQVDDGTISLAGVANAFVASPEFISDYGSLSNSAFVNQMYENGLGRPADAASVGWEALLANGTSRGTVALDIAESGESISDSLPTAGDNNTAEVYRLYQTVFDRAPDAAGAAGWVADLNAGQSVTQVAQDFVNSAEFLRDYGSLSISDFVTALYNNALGRAPAASELQGWTNQLAAGASQASVIVGFSDSVESRADTAGATHANWVFIPS